GYYNLTPEGKASVDRARAMVKAGQGNQVATFSNNNQGRSLQVETTAANYLSYFDPNGPCDMHRTAGSVGVPAMWIAGTNDQVLNWGADIGRRVTARPKSAYVVLPGATHVSTPSQASGQIVTWLQQV
ncbi:MAG: alpha/beta hydrolase, partial [Hyphomicrobiales bacterium]|nr:alpha/beta hydrolase [Hyphomicrobiales bacterium]